MKRITTILILFGFLLPSFSFAQTQTITPPETLEGAKETGERAIKALRESLPGIIEKIWQEEVLPIWQKMYNWAKENLWDSWIGPWLKNIWHKILKIFGQEMEERKPVIQEEFQKEKQELREEAPQVGKTLWEKFKELIK